MTKMLYVNGNFNRLSKMLFENFIKFETRYAQRVSKVSEMYPSRSRGTSLTASMTQMDTDENGVVMLGDSLIPRSGCLSRPVSPKLALEAVLAKPPYFDEASAQWLSKMRESGVQNEKNVTGDWWLVTGE